MVVTVNKSKKTKNKKKNQNNEEKKQKSVNIFKKTINTKRKKYCSPKNENNDYSCFSKNSLINIIKEWNKKNKNKI